MTSDDEVSCSANTSQSCSYRWKWFSGDDVTSESDNQILKPKKVGRHRCEATCSFRSRSCTVNVMYAEVYTTELQPIHVYSNAGMCKSNSQVITISVSARYRFEIIKIDLTRCTMCFVPRRDPNSKILIRV